MATVANPNNEKGYSQARTLFFTAALPSQLNAVDVHSVINRVETLTDQVAKLQSIRPTTSSEFAFNLLSDCAKTLKEIINSKAATAVTPVIASENEEKSILAASSI